MQYIVFNLFNTKFPKFPIFWQNKSLPTNSKASGQFETIRAVLKLSGQFWICSDSPKLYWNHPDSIETVWIVLKPSGQYRNHPDSTETLQIQSNPPRGNSYHLNNYIYRLKPPFCLGAIYAVWIKFDLLDWHQTLNVQILSWRAEI